MSVKGDLNEAIKSLEKENQELKKEIEQLKDEKDLLLKLDTIKNKCTDNNDDLPPGWHERNLLEKIAETHDDNGMRIRFLHGRKGIETWEVYRLIEGSENCASHYHRGTIAECMAFIEASKKRTNRK